MLGEDDVFLLWERAILQICGFSIILRECQDSGKVNEKKKIVGLTETRWGKKWSEFYALVRIRKESSGG